MWTCWLCWLIAFLVPGSTGLNARDGEYRSLHMPTPRLSHVLAERDATLRVELTLNRSGYVTRVQFLETSDPAFELPVAEALLRWRFEVPRSAANRDNLVLVRELDFKRGALSVSSGDEGIRPPEVLRRNPIEVPTELERVLGWVDLGVLVDEQGAVERCELLGSSHPELEEVAKRGVAGWDYAPGVENGLKVKGMLRLVLNFGLPKAKREKPLDERTKVSERDVILLRSSAPVIPVDFRSEDFETRALVHVDAYGFVEYAELLDDPGLPFALAVLDALYSWKYVPVQRDGVAVPVEVEHPIRYIREMLVMSSVKRDRYPVVRKRVQPVVPSKLKGVQGSVTLLVNLSAEGRVIDARVQETTHEGLAESSLKAVRNWRFDPALDGNRRVPCQVVIPIYFR